MRIEVGKKYKRHSDIVEVKFIDCDGNGWGLSVNGRCICLEFLDYHWQEVTDKPDPGEGWRLLEVGERLQEGDEYLSIVNDWLQANITYKDGIICNGAIYRRRIAPQYVPYTWDDREELRGRWYRRNDNKDYERQVTLFDGGINNMFINGWEAKEFLQKCEWLDGSPCGKKVV
jgi:hypothetical protein